MKSQWISKTFTYDGTQLRSLFAYLEFGVLGDSVIAWRGPCEVSFEHMVDGEDLRAQAKIAGADMVHFIVEKFETSLFTAVALQRLLASLCLETLTELDGRPDKKTLLKRDGDDIFLGSGKVSISIATQSPVSSLIHFAVNVSNRGTPVETAALEDFNIEPKAFAERLMNKFCLEMNSIREASQKVKWVK